ncbi:MAG TPA: DNA ligase D [Chitinophagaceae bacterium]|jgi:bifunctional non-homologous end joining protein LigD|nr:DNA ligase D [Chitinophagaceae bacterium]
MNAALRKLLKKGKSSAIPGNIEPMLATLVDEIPVDEQNWIYEIKWDGYRAIAYLNKGVVDIRSRNNKSFNEKFYPVYDALKKWDANAVVDGEVIVVNDEGMPDFSDLQLWRSEADGQVAFYLFDILWLEGFNVMNLPLEERHQLLQAIIPEKNNIIKISEQFNTSGKDFFSLAEQLKLEGIFAKRLSSTYTPGNRSKDWLKIKTEKRQEFVIGGYTKNENTSKLFSALLVGLYENGEFHFVTPVGTGFNTAIQKDILKKLKPDETKICPFIEEPEYNKPSRFRPNPPKAKVTWVKPKLVAEISFREVTKDGAIRHPSFKGLREDKKPVNVVREIPKETSEVTKRSNEKIKNTVLQKGISKPPEKERKTLLNPTDEAQTRAVGGHNLGFSNLSKIFWPKEKLTKRDMINYYYQVAPFMLPYMKDRPQTLNRHPHGINGESFYQKNVKGKVPEWIETFPYYSETDAEEKEFLVCTNEASLLYIASLGCIEMNPWSSRRQSPENPDWCIIDLDPDKNTFEQVIKAAQVTKQILDAIEIPSYCKTSGSTGLHIYIPLGAKYSYEDSKEFGRSIVKLVHGEVPSFTSIERKTADRQGKMYLDFLQNRPQATVAAPYSLRPKPFAPVSMPLHWEEVKKGLKLKDHNLKNAIARLREMGDPFKGVIGKGINMKKAIRKMKSVFKIM